MRWLLPLAFVSGFLLDFLWVRCVHSVSQKKPVTAANLSVLMYLCTLLPTVLIVESNVVGVSLYIVGGWLGTLLSTRWS